MGMLSTYTEEEKQKAIQSLLKRKAYNRQYLQQYNRGHRQEHKEYDQQYYQAHKEEMNKSMRQYYQEHKDAIQEYHRQYYLEHEEERSEFMHQYYLIHKEEMSESTRQYYQEHKTELAEWQRQYNREHHEVHRASNHKRRAQTASSTENFTPEEFGLLCETYEGRCAYCHEVLPLGPDHKVPLCKGGSNGIENIVPSCLPCNLKKHTMTYDEYMRKLKPVSIIAGIH